MALGPSLLFRYGQLLMLLKRRARALDVFKSVARESPGHPRAWSHVAFLHAEREELLPALERALEIDPGLDRARHGLSRPLARLGRT